MRPTGFFGVILILAGVALASAGCATSSKSATSSGATTPQDKAHQEQLADMSRRDAESAAEQPPAPRRPQRGRRTGQRVIDQPTRP